MTMKIFSFRELIYINGDRKPGPIDFRPIRSRKTETNRRGKEGEGIAYEAKNVRASSSVADKNYRYKMARPSRRWSSAASAIAIAATEEEKARRARSYAHDIRISALQMMPPLMLLYLGVWVSNPSSDPFFFFFFPSQVASAAVWYFSLDARKNRFCAVCEEREFKCTRQRCDILLLELH